MGWLFSEGLEAQRRSLSLLGLTGPISRKPPSLGLGMASGDLPRLCFFRPLLRIQFLFLALALELDASVWLSSQIFSQPLPQFPLHRPSWSRYVQHLLFPLLRAGALAYLPSFLRACGHSKMSTQGTTWALESPCHGIQPGWALVVSLCPLNHLVALPKSIHLLGGFGKLREVPGQAPSRVSGHSLEREPRGSRLGQLPLPEEPSTMNSCFDRGPWELHLCWLNRQEVNMRRGDRLRLPVQQVSL